MDCTQLEACLDRLMDDELSQDEQREMDAHCAHCAACADKARSTRLLRDLFSELPDEIDVPLKAQAAWRSAVKAEAGKKRARLAFRWAGGIAAALAVAVGGMFALNRGTVSQSAETVAQENSVQRIEADSYLESEAVEAAGESIDDAVYRAMPMNEWTVVVEDLDRTCAYMADLVSEYEGTLEVQRYETDGVDCANLYIELPAENAADFLEAAAHYDVSGTLESAANAEDAEGRVSLLLVLKAGGE